MSDDLDPRILAKWLLGSLDSDEQRVLDRWLAADPARAVELAQARELWRRAGEVARAQAVQPDAHEALRWAGIIGRIREQDAPPSTRRTGRPLTLELPRRRRPVERWVAAAVLVIAAGGGLWALTHHGKERQLAEVPPPMRTYETARGERAEFRLGDGTRVMLNVASRIRVPADFGARVRDVYLEGGAYFEVVHDSTRPFAVHAGDIVARDLGTEFTVGAYPEQRHARVVVRQGLVALHRAAAEDTGGGATVHPGQQGRLDDGGTPKVQRADTTAEFAWTGGTLVFDGVPLRDALLQLGRWFDLEFRLSADSLGRIHLAATLTNQPTDDALRFLAASLGLRSERRGRVVTFYPAFDGSVP
jgi:transmembrane sensor